MIAAFLTALFFAFSGVFGRRSIEAVGTARANLGRLIFGLLCLGLYAHLWGQGWRGAGRGWFAASGAMGMGLGDVGLYLALALIGSRLAVLMTQCLAVPVAMLAEWLWLGTTLSGPDLLWSGVILTGVILALVPSRGNPPKVQVKPIGFVFGAVAAVGQGLGAVLSRKANAVGVAAGFHIDGMTAAYQRICGGFVFTVLYFAIRALIERGRERAPVKPPALSQYGWIVANTLAGAVIGISLYQMALATTPSGIVLPIVATTPLLIIPMSYLMEHDRPTVRSLIGAAVAVVGVIALALVKR